MSTVHTEGTVNMAVFYEEKAYTGLSNAEVRQRQESGRQNTAPERVTKSTGQILRDNICTLFNLFNLLIAVALALVGAWSNMLFMAIIVLNTVIGIVQELNAKRLVDKLSLLNAPTAVAIRDGEACTIHVQELVVDDVVELASGAQVSADCVILSGAVEVNESLLTGEAEPVRHAQGEHLLSGSFIVSGLCRAQVEHVGSENYAVKLALEAKRLRRVNSELLRSMRRVTHFTAYLIPPLGVLLFLEAYFLRAEAVDQAVVTTAAALLGMLPKGLVLLISISLAAGIAVLAKKRVLVQELFALETLAHVDTLCLDKTGTLTTGRMTVEDVLLTDLGEELSFEELMAAFVTGSQDNNATYHALKERFGSSGGLMSLSRVPFSSERKWSAVTFEDFTLVVGAPEKLAGRAISELLEDTVRSGKRVLLAGITRDEVLPEQPLPELEWLGTIVIADELRPEAVETLDFFKREGVDLKLISGDNPETVAALGARAGFPNAARYVDMSGITDDAGIERAAANYSVFGRTTPQQKQKLVRALQKQGRTVAMTGDGVNDLLALREADCSIAVAEGSDAARQIAQVVLLDSDFSALPDVLAQGRRVVNNITRVAAVFFVKTVYSVLLSLVCLLLNIPFPLIPIQVTLIDLVIEGYPAFFMSFEPDGRKVTGRFLPTVLRRAAPNAIAILACFLILPVMPLDSAQGPTVFYLLVGTVGIMAVFKASRPMNALRVFLCVTMTLGFYAAVFLFHSMLRVEPLAMPDIPVFLALSLVSFLIKRGVTALIKLFDARGGKGEANYEIPRRTRLFFRMALCAHPDAGHRARMPRFVFCIGVYG